MTKVTSTLALAAIVFTAAALLCYELTEPFTGHRDRNSAWMTTAGQNHVQHGFEVTRLGVIKNNHPGPSEWFQVYTSHPPLVPVFVSFSLAVFGNHEWAARLVPILFSLATTVLVYRLGVALGGSRLGLVAAGIHALLPMTAYFGRMVNHEAPTNFFALLCAFTYLKWQRSRRWPFLAISVSALVLAGLCDWPGYYFALILPLHYLATKDSRDRPRSLLLFPATVVLLFVSHLAHIYWLVGPSALESMASKFLLRTSAGLTLGSHSSGFTWADYAWRQMTTAYRLFTLPVLLLGAYSIYCHAVRRQRGVVSDQLFIWALLAFGAVHVVLFSEAAWAHDYWQFYLSGPVALLAASGALLLSARASRRAVLVILSVIFLISAMNTYGAHHRRTYAGIAERAEQISMHARPDQAVRSNDPIIYQYGPILGYYAERDISADPILNVKQLQDTLARLPRPYAIFYFQGRLRENAYYLQQESQEALREWLSARFESVDVEIVGREYQVFYVEGDGRARAPSRDP